MKTGSIICYFMSIWWFGFGSWQAYVGWDSSIGIQRAQLAILSGIWMLGVSFWLRKPRPQPPISRG